MAPHATQRRSVVFAGDDGTVRDALSTALGARGIHLLATPALRDAATACQCAGAAVAVLAVPHSADPIALDVIGEVRAAHARAAVILLAATGRGTIDLAALRAGARDYYEHPVSMAELIDGIMRCLADEGPAGAAGHDTTGQATPLIGSSAVMRRVRGYAALVARHESRVIITGETGTGKEILARAVHDQSPRKRGPFVAVNCAAIPDTLIESELFGHERGAFTGAHATREGQLRLAHGGTLLLDEIGDMELHAQAKILRALESRQVVRVGGRQQVPVDVRIVAATHHDLDADVADGRFHDSRCSSTASVDRDR